MYIKCKKNYIHHCFCSWIFFKNFTDRKYFKNQFMVFKLSLWKFYSHKCVMRWGLGRKIYSPIYVSSIMGIDITTPIFHRQNGMAERKKNYKHALLSEFYSAMLYTKLAIYTYTHVTHREQYITNIYIAKQSMRRNN